MSAIAFHQPLYEERTITPDVGTVIEKPWGVTRCIHRSAACEVWHASIRKGGKSSFHRHEHKANDFYVLFGTLKIEIGLNAGVELFSGGRYSLTPGRVHKFTALTDVELIETYWLPPIDPNDIEREGA